MKGYDVTIIENSLYIASEDGGVHYPVAGDGSLDAPCACNECRAGQRGELERPYGQGHFLCCGCPDELLWAEERGLVGAIFTNNRWTWYRIESVEWTIACCEALFCLGVRQD